MNGVKDVVLIGVCGAIGAGKTTVANIIRDEFDLVEESFASGMKEGLKTMLGLTDDQVYGNSEVKERAIPLLSDTDVVSPRTMMQTLATDWGRNMVHPDIWIFRVARRWKELLESEEIYHGMVIHDVRFENEARWIKEQGGYIIQVDDSRVTYGRPPQVEGHESEKGIPSHLVDTYLSNLHNGLGILVDQVKGAVWAMSLKRKEESANIISPIDSIQSAGQAELQSEIAVWADSVFPERTITNAVSKMVMEEIPEYLTSQHDPMELADVGILLYDIAHLAGIDLHQAIRTKMVINRERSWEICPDTGLMNHIQRDKV